MNLILKAYTLSQCMELMAEYAQAYEAQGKKNLIFCEDRLTLIAERALLRKTGGTFLSSVSTFARFLKSENRSISKQGSVMAVGEVMTRLQSENALQCFTTAAGIGNNAKTIYETLAQFAASELTPEIVRESANALEEDLLKRKISDLGLIYEGYVEFLNKNGYVDESRYLSLLPAQIKTSEEIKGNNVFFLCFNSFTAQAKQVIRAALESAANVIGIFVCGEDEIYTGKAKNAFAAVCGEYGNYKEWDRGTPLSGESEVLRKGLFDPEKVETRMETQSIRIFEAMDKTSEAEYVAVQIRRAMEQNPTMRYRDISVLTPNVNDYSLALKKAFSEYAIPYFIDEKKSLKRHPLGEFILACLRVVKERYSPASVQNLTQNVFFGESDEYRNYLCKFANYRGGASRAIKTGNAVEELFSLEKLESGRNRLLLATKRIKTKAKGREYCQSIRQILEDFDAENTLNTLKEQVQDLAQKGFLDQIYRALVRMLDEAELLMGDRELSVEEFAAIIEDGLDATELSLIPLKMDAVFIGNVIDSRIEKTNVLFTLGMLEDVPRCGSDTSIVSDKEIDRLEQIKMQIEPKVAEVNLRNRESLALNLCSFTDELHLSYPLATDGSEPAVSEVFRYIDRLFCRQTEKGGDTLLREKNLPDEEFAYRCSALSPAIRQLLIEKNEYETRKTDYRNKYSSLYAALDKLSVTEKDDFLAERDGQVCVERGKELFFSDEKISPTAIESYFSCPFKHFAEKGLKLREREETAVLALDSGNFIHTLLEKVTKKIDKFQTEAETIAYAKEVGTELLKDSVYTVQEDTGSGAYFTEKLVQEGVAVSVAVFRQLKQSSFQLEETEKTVFTDEFYGKIDRVDGSEKYVRIIDYKTGKIDDSAAAYYTGQKVQMQLYMSALRDERIPAGVFYFPAVAEYRDSLDGRYRMKGFLNGDTDALLCGDNNLTEGVKSEFFAASLKNDGKATKIMDEETFRNFLDYSVHVARQGAAELKEGYIAPSPYKDSCDYCKYGGMCGFRYEKIEVRQEKDITPKQIAEIARTQREGKEDK
ncbi:MAG: exodeoxyribonuclease V subunit gamma [Clostridia bacterium]|nr:exodeoxyribonuclease V subunit gamma [Clostridia bacterium]